MPDHSSPNVGTLYLIPTFLGEASLESSVTPIIARIIGRLSYFLVEEEKSARNYIKQVAPHRNLRDLTLNRLDEHTPLSDVERLMTPLFQGHDMGIISEAGCPAIADPGAMVVRRAHERGVTVRPLVGPCSMTLALMSSGFNGQRWRFVGYLPVDDTERRSTLLRLENLANSSGETQIMMETPYRNQKLLTDIITHCRPDTKLCVASSLTTPSELVEVHTVAEWRKLERTLLKNPALFLLGA